MTNGVGTGRSLTAKHLNYVMSSATRGRHLLKGQHGDSLQDLALNGHICYGSGTGPTEGGRWRGGQKRQTLSTDHITAYSDQPDTTPDALDLQAIEKLDIPNSVHGTYLARKGSNDQFTRFNLYWEKNEANDFEHQYHKL